MSSISTRIAAILNCPQSRTSLLAAVADRQQVLAELGRVDVECQLARDSGRLSEARRAYQRLRELEKRLEST